MVIVDNGDPGYSEAGAWSTAAGGSYGGDHRVATTVTGSATASATFTPTFPTAGSYAVYLWYRGDGDPGDGVDENSADTQITIRHPGGVTLWIQNQNRDGFTWLYLGSYFFEAGANPLSGAVEISNSSALAGEQVVADAVRFGGGIGDLVDPESGDSSGKPRWEESGRYYAGFLGKSDWASSNTVNAMPRWAAWEAEPWEAGKSIYLSWHTNAPDPGTGTSSFAYSSAGWDGAFDGVAGGLELRNAVHSELINDIRAGWDPAWPDRGNHTNWYGEINPTNNSEMPGSLHEIAFHDTPSDAANLKEPDFRRLAARAVYQGIVRYYSEEVAGFDNPTLLPEPPTHLRARNLGGGALEVAWDAPPSDTGDGLFGDPATGYRLYLSTHRKEFDDPLPVVGGSTTLTGLAQGEVFFLRVSATNSGGESFPTPTLAVRTTVDGAAPVLLVDGFDRIDAAANLIEDDPDSSDPLHRGYLWRMNTYDYSIAHARALAAAGVAFDGASNEAVRDGRLALSDYAGTVWILGEESSADKTFDASERALVESFLAAGGSLFVSGAEIGWELDYLGAAPDFFHDVLHAAYQADDGGSYTVAGVPGTIFAGIDLSFDDGTEIYDVDWPDRLAGQPGAVVAMEYTAPGSGGAAITFAGGAPERRTVLFGFPFETILDEDDRQAIMARAFDFFCAGQSALCSDGLIFGDGFESGTTGAWSSASG